MYLIFPRVIGQDYAAVIISPHSSGVHTNGHGQSLGSMNSFTFTFDIHGKCLSVI